MPKHPPRTPTNLRSTSIVGWRVKVAFDDGNYYGGEVMKIEEGYDGKPYVKDGGSWWLHIKYDDGDDQITEFPNHNVRIDMAEDTIHGMHLGRRPTQQRLLRQLVGLATWR